MKRCAVCGTPTERFLSFGPMPLANGFLSAAEFDHEAYFDLAAEFCPGCTLVQLADPVPRERMFHDHYPFFTSSSQRMSAHFARFAQEVKEAIGRTGNPLVVEIGSNDGTLLRHFADAGTAHLGIEPSANVAAAASALGVRTRVQFFDQRVAAEVRREFGAASALLAANCFCHIRDLQSLAEGVTALLAPEGRLYFEDPYLGDILAQNAYDQIYDEHLYYFSLGSVSAWLAPHGLEVVDVQPQPVHGGSMRYTVARRGAYPASAGVGALREREGSAGLHSRATYERFRLRVERSRDALRETLEGLRRSGRRVVGYGATSKSTTVTNFCGITPALVEFIADTTPLKQGRYSPGAHLPVRPTAEFHSRFPDCALLFAWNHAGEIMAKETAFRAQGGKWLLYVPEVALA